MARPTGDKPTEEQLNKILEDAIRETFEGGDAGRERVVRGGGSIRAEYERRRAVIVENVARAREIEARREAEVRDNKMCLAIIYNDGGSVRELLSKYEPGELTNHIVKEGGGATFLIFAAVQGRLEAVNILINEAGVDIFKRDAAGLSALDSVIREKMVHKKRLNSPLTEIRGVAYSTNNFPEIIKALTPYTLTSESSPEQKHYYGIALIGASANNDAETVKMLYEEKGADVNYRNPVGAGYPLDVAIFNKAKDAFEVLRDSGKLVISEADRRRASTAFGPAAVVASAAGRGVGGAGKEDPSLGGGGGGGGSGRR